MSRSIQSDFKRKATEKSNVMLCMKVIVLTLIILGSIDAIRAADIGAPASVLELIVNIAHVVLCLAIVFLVAAIL